MKKAFLIRLTEEEFDRVTALANATALSREAFVRRVLQGAAITEKPPAEYGEIVRELRRIGSDVNQLLVKAKVARLRGNSEVGGNACFAPQDGRYFYQSVCREISCWETITSDSEYPDPKTSLPRKGRFSLEDLPKNSNLTKKNRKRRAKKEKTTRKFKKHLDISGNP